MSVRYLLWDNFYSAKNIQLNSLSAFIIHILRGGKEMGKDYTWHHYFFHTTVLCSLTFGHPSPNFHKSEFSITKAV